MIPLGAGDNELRPYLRGWADGAGRLPLADDEDADRPYGMAQLLAVYQLGRAVGRSEGPVDPDIVEAAGRISARLFEASTPSDLPPPRTPRPRHWPSRRRRVAH